MIRNEMHLIKVAQAYARDESLGDACFEKVAWAPLISAATRFLPTAARYGSKLLGYGKNMLSAGKKAVGGLRANPGVTGRAGSFAKKHGSNYVNYMKQKPVEGAFNTMMGIDALRSVTASDDGRAYGYMEARTKLACCVHYYHQTEDAAEKAALKKEALAALKSMGA